MTPERAYAIITDQGEKGFISFGGPAALFSRSLPLTPVSRRHQFQRRAQRPLCSGSG